MWRREYEHSPLFVARLFFVPLRDLRQWKNADRKYMGFQELNISKQILRALEDVGFEEPTPIQKEVFPLSRAGKDVIGIAQTGTGKTLAYLIPMLMKLHYAQGLVPRALVVVPTRA